MNNINPHLQISFSASIFLSPVTANNSSTWASVGPLILGAEGISQSFAEPATDAPDKVTLILDQLAEYMQLPELERAELQDLLIFCTSDEQKTVWDKCVDSRKDIEVIQLFIDSGLAEGIVNSRNSAGCSAAMEAVQRGEHETLGLLLNIATIDLKEKLPDGDTLLIRSVKNADMEIFNLLVNDPRVDVFDCDDDDSTAYENATVQGEFEMMDKLLARMEQADQFSDAEDFPA